ncbi:hypothetical protein BDR26DRAFT_853016, partial [Obelidium mucronatum]
MATNANQMAVQLQTDAEAQTITVTVPFVLVGLGIAASAVSLLFFIRFVVLTKYTRLPPVQPLPNAKYDEAPFDLRLNLGVDEDESEFQHRHHRHGKHYSDLVDVLRNVKAFGYLDRHVLDDLAKHLVTRKVRAGYSLAAATTENGADDSDFCIVLDGTVGVFVKGNSAVGMSTTSFSGASSAYAYSTGFDSGDSDSESVSTDEEDIESRGFAQKAKRMNLGGYHLLNQVKRGGVVSSMFSILSVLTEDVKLSGRHGASDAGKPQQSLNVQNPLLPPDFLPVPPSPVNLSSETHGNFDAETINFGSTPTVESFLRKRMESNQTVSTSPDHLVSPTRHSSLNHQQKLMSRGSTTKHPHITSIALTDVKLLVIPAAAFRSLRFTSLPHRPSSFSLPRKHTASSSPAHVAQVLLTRFLRVSAYSMDKYLGLKGELLEIEKGLSSSIAAEISPLDASLVDKIRRRCGELRKMTVVESVSTQKGSNVSGLLGIGLGIKAGGGGGALTDSEKHKSAGGGGSDIGQSFLTEGLRKRPVAVDGSESDSSAIGYSPSFATPSLIRKRNTIMGATSQITRLRQHMQVDSKTRSDSKILVGDRNINMNATVQLPSVDPQQRKENLKLFSNVLKSPVLAPTTPAALYNESGLPGVLLETGLNDDKDYIDSICHAMSLILGINTPLMDGAPSDNTPNYEYHASVDSVDSTTDDGMDSVSVTSSQASSDFWAGRPNNPGSSNRFKSKDLLIVSLERGDVLVKEGERSAGLCIKHEAKGKKKSVFLIQPGSVAGYLSAVMGHPSLVTIKAKTDTQVGFLPKAAVDKYVERHPNVILMLAKRLETQISPLAYQVDFALDWSHVNAGQVLYRQGDQSNSIFIILAGRLRSIGEQNETDSPVSTRSPTEVPENVKQRSKFEIYGEIGPGESIGELEVLTESRRPSTVHAIRDTEIAILPKTLFNALAIRYPEMTIQISRMLAARSQGLAIPAMGSNNVSSLNPFGSANELDEMLGTLIGGGAPNPALAAASGARKTRAKNNYNLKTVGIVPVNSMVPIAQFADRLRQGLELVGASVALLNNAAVVGKMGKHVFSPIGKLKLMSWLAEQEDTHRLVLYVADGGIGQDCILLVGLGDEDPAIGEYERLVLSLKTTARKELVLLHNERYCVPGSTAAWLKSRLWIHAHHHVQMPLSSPRALQRDKNTMMDLQAHFQKFYSQATGSLLNGNSHTSPKSHTGVRSDFARIARRLLNKSIGLALGGGGARGIAHVGIIRALEEAGIPIDMIGGTSIGSFVGGLYARENDHVSIYGRSKQLSGVMSSKWRQFVDLTYPLTSLFTGHELNRAIWKSFNETQIEDCWLPYFSVSVNITDSRIEVHQSGYMWRYVRASMSLVGYFPPLCDDGKLLVDGGYLNLVPVDVILNKGADVAIAVDVTYGDSLSGWWLFFARFIPGATSAYGRIPLLPDIQDRLAFAGSVERLQRAKSGEFYLRPAVSHFGASEFHKYKDIYEIGYKYGKEMVSKWEKDGTMLKRFGIAR